MKENSLERLSNKIWLTRASRFAAYRRMTNHDIFCNLSIAILTVIIIGINLLVFILPQDMTNTITILTIMLSVFVLAISQHIYARDFKIKAHKFHECGCELSLLYDEIELIKGNDISIDQIKELYKKYEDIIIKYNENHSYLDYKLVKAKTNIENAHKSITKHLTLYLLICKYYIIEYLIYILLISTPYFCWKLLECLS